MRLGTHAVGRGRYVRRGHPVAGGAVAFLFAVGLFAAPALEAQGTQAGTQFSNWATLTFISAGTGYAVASDTVAILVGQVAGVRTGDRKSTRLNSSHLVISYAVFCLKKKKLNVTSSANRAMPDGIT